MTRMFRTVLLVSSLLISPQRAVGSDESSQNPETTATDNSSLAAAEVPEESVSATDESKYLLRHRFQPGEVIKYRSKRVDEMIMTVAGQSKTDVTRTEQIRRFEVSNLEESGQANLVMQFESVEMSLQVNGGDPIVYRSSMKPDEVPGMFTVVANRLRGGASQFVVLPTGPPIDENGNVVLPDAVDSPETRLMMPLPEHAVEIGETWKYYNRVKVRVAEGIVREIRLLTTCRLESVEDGTARIRFSTSPTIRLKSNMVKALLVGATPHGYCLMDLETGRMKKRVTRNNNSVHGVKGPESLLTYSSEVVEVLLPKEASVSQR